jgi:hypothetical protein
MWTVACTSRVEPEIHHVLWINGSGNARDAQSAVRPILSFNRLNGLLVLRSGSRRSFAARLRSEGIENDVSQVKGLRQAFNSWIVTSAGFFGKGTKATLTVYAVNGTAPALITGKENPISNVVRETFTIAA